MHAYSLSHLSDPTLLRDLTAHVGRGWANTAIVLAHLAEVDARRLYLPEGYPSMFSYCLHVLRFSEGAALKRIRAARVAREFPAVFELVANGRVHLSGLVLLASRLTPENSDDLLAAATHKTKAEIEHLLAQRFPRPDVPTLVQAIGPPPAGREDLALGQVGDPGLRASAELSPGTVARDTVTPLAPQRYAMQLTIDEETQDLLRRAQELLGHQLPSGDVAGVVRRALRALVTELEKRKCAATEAPRTTRRPSKASRHIPAHVKRAVWERDGGQCTFVSESGQRCPARARLEFDHVLEVARGGEATVDGVRLRCRAHNQYTAERTFGVAFMERKRAEAKLTSSQLRESEQDVEPLLRRLGFRSREARDAAAYCANIPEASLEQRLRAALSFLRPASRREARPCP